MYERNWRVIASISGFKAILFVYGSEVEMQDYMKSELGYIPAYVGASDEMVAQYKAVGGKVYLAPRKEESR